MYSHPIGEHSLNVLAAIAAGRDKPSVSITGGLFPKQKGNGILWDLLILKPGITWTLSRTVQLLIPTGIFGNAILTVQQ